MWLAGMNVVLNGNFYGVNGKMGNKVEAMAFVLCIIVIREKFQILYRLLR